MLVYTWTVTITKDCGHQIPGDMLMVYNHPVYGIMKEMIDRYYSIYGEDAAPIEIILDHGMFDSPDVENIMSINYDRQSNLLRIIMRKPFSDYSFTFTIITRHPGDMEDS